MKYLDPLRSSVALIALTTALLYPSVTHAQTSDDVDEVVITGVQILDNSTDGSIAGLSILGDDELDDRIVASIGETLKSEPGVSSTFFGPAASRPIIRGQDGDRIRVLVNGIGTIDASSFSPDHAVSADPAQAEQIEVLRGASILRFGSSGAGGVVNVIDGRIPSEMPDGTEVAVRIGASSVDMGRAVAASIDHALGENIALHLDISKSEADNFRIPGFAESEILHAAEEVAHEDEDHEDEDQHEDDHEDGHHVDQEGEAKYRVDNSWSEARTITGGLSYIVNKGFIGVSLQNTESRYGLPGGHEHHHEEGEHHDEDEDHAEDEEHHDEDEDHDEDEHHEDEHNEDVYIELKQTRFDLNAARELGGFFERVQLFAAYADYKHTEFEDEGVGTVYTNEGWESRLEFIQSEKNDWRAAYGMHIKSRDFAVTGLEAFVPPTQTNQLGFYTFQEKDMGPFHLEAAARFENTKQENVEGNVSKSFDLFSASVGADYHLSDNMHLGLMVSKSERAPTSEELYANGPHIATNAFEIGNAELGKEAATGMEMAYRMRGERYSLSGNVFYTDYNDYIFGQLRGDEEDGLEVYEYVAADTTFQGGEIQGRYDLGKIGAFSLSVNGLAEYVRAKTDTGNIPRIPPLSVLVGGDIGWDNFNLRAEVDYAAKQDKLGANELLTESYTLLNSFLTWNAPVGEGEAIKFKLSVLNLLDEEARQHSSFLKDVVPLPGRNFRVSVAAKF